MGTKFNIRKNKEGKTEIWLDFTQKLDWQDVDCPKCKNNILKVRDIFKEKGTTTCKAKIRYHGCHEEKEVKLPFNAPCDKCKKTFSIGVKRYDD